MGADPGGGGHFAGFGYHAAMVGDPHRMIAFERALRRVVVPGARVLDVGTGTGVLALMAARLGAGHVWAVESTPIARLARQVVAANGMSDRVTVIEADMRTLAAPDSDDAKVDVIVSDCLGRFVVDDFMGDAMASALRWLKPGGRVIPASVELVVAPVAIGHIAALDLWRDPVFGLDLSPIGKAATERPLAAALGDEALLTEPAVVGVWAPGQRTPVLEHDPRVFSVVRPGRLRAFAGWFRAELGGGVVLETAPGVETHWHQLLFPVAPAQVDAGTQLSFRLELKGVSAEPIWAWHVASDLSGAQTKAYGADDGSFVLHAVEATSRQPHETAEAASEAGAVAFELGEVEAALGHFEAALRLHFGERQVMASNEPDPDHVLRRLLADIGTAAVIAGLDRRALLPLLAVVTEHIDDANDNPANPRNPHLEQALRLFVDVAFRLGRYHDGARFLRKYEQLFGAHPSEWRPR